MSGVLHPSSVVSSRVVGDWSGGVLLYVCYLVKVNEEDIIPVVDR